MNPLHRAGQDLPSCSDMRKVPEAEGEGRPARSMRAYQTTKVTLRGAPPRSGDVRKGHRLTNFHPSWHHKNATALDSPA
jgi:hypothetical protein